MEKYIATKRIFIAYSDTALLLNDVDTMLLAGILDNAGIIYLIKDI
jgi:hypothetical protein